MGKEKGREILHAGTVDAMLLTGAANMRYVAGFTGEGYVYLSEQSAVIVTDSRYTIAAKRECRDFKVEQWNGKPYFEILKSYVERDGIKTLGFEEEEMTVSEFQSLRKMLPAELAALEPLGEQVTKWRAVKTSSEIDKICRAEEIGDCAFARLLKELEIGMTEKQVAARLEFYMKEEGADGLSFDTIAASGIHSAMPHAVPTDKKLQEGEFLTMDFGCVYEGYCSDMTRTVMMGRANQKQREIYYTVLSAQKEALERVRPGMKGCEVDSLARKVIEDAGYGKYFGHSLGHSVGLYIHEKPCFAPKDETVIEPGMVITVEPGIYVEGFGGVRIEDVVVITKDGCENITHSPKRLLEIGCSAGN